MTRSNAGGRGPAALFYEARVTDHFPGDRAAEIARRCAFAIICHPDAGKTAHVLRACSAIRFAVNVRATAAARYPVGGVPPGSNQP
jgi:hypothetical protein